MYRVLYVVSVGCLKDMPMDDVADLKGERSLSKQACKDVMPLAECSSAPTLTSLLFHIKSKL